MAKCGCTQGACFCVFEDSDSVTWTGTGSVSDPFTATPKDLLTVGDTSTLALDLDVAGDTAILTAQPIIGAHVDVFLADGTWTKPVGVTFARVLMVGAGGGGASGQVGSTSTVKGGGPGDGAGVAIITLVDTEIPATAAIVIGQGGAGGLAATTGNGNAGAAGGATEFDTFLVQGGSGGQPLGLAGSHLARGVPPGQQAVDWTVPFTEAHYYLAPGAGGGGEGRAYQPWAGGYSHPGQGSRFPSDTGGGTAGGGDGRDEPTTKMGGGGGGGGQGTAGGDGGLYGGGGGGGGYALAADHVPSGAGGNGADGICVVVSW